MVAIGLADADELPAELRDARGAADARPRPRTGRAAAPGATPSACSSSASAARRARPERLRVAAATAAKQAAAPRGGLDRLGRAAGRRPAPRAPAALVEGTVLAAYRFDRYRGADADDSPPPAIDRLVLVRRGRRPRGGRGRGRDRAAWPPRPPTARASCRTCPPTSSPRRRSRRRAREIAAAHEPVEVDVLGPDGDRGARAWAGSSPSRAAATVEPRADRAALLGRRRGPAPRARRQGRHLRQRRDLDQAVGGDARDEDGHVRRRRGARGGRRDRRARARARARRGDPVDREHAERHGGRGPAT